MCENEAAPTGVRQHSNRGLTHLSYQEGVNPMLRKSAAPGRPDARAKINLIRSIAGHAEGRETDALAEIQAALDGASLEELAAMRAGAGA